MSMWIQLGSRWHAVVKDNSDLPQVITEQTNIYFFLVGSNDFKVFPFSASNHAYGGLHKILANANKTQFLFFLLLYCL